MFLWKGVDLSGLKRSEHSASSRRHFVASGAMSLAGFALATLLRNERLTAESPEQKDPFLRPELEQKTFDVKPKQPHFEPTAKAMISLWMQGGPSHLDLFDPKPVLQKLDGKEFDGDIKYDNAAQASAKVLGSPWKFKTHGQCGMELSELLPGLAEVVDDITLIRSMHTGVNNHGQSIRALQNGRILGGRPTVGSWLTYGLGCETENLPAYVALIDPGQLPVMGVENWSNGFLPSLYQGTVVRPQEPRILNLDPPPHLKGRLTATRAGLLGTTQSPASRPASRLSRSRGSHRQLRTGRADADGRQGSRRFQQRVESDTKDVRHGGSGDEGIRIALPDRPAADRTRRPLCAGLY